MALFGEDGPDTDGIRNQWAAFMDKPGAQAAMLQFGISLMQPPGFGDTGAAQVGRAVGAAGEAVGRQEAMDIKQREAASREELAAARSAAVGAGAETKQAQLAQRASEFDRKMEQANLNRSMKYYMQYPSYIKGVRARNAQNQLLGQPLEAEVTPQEFARQKLQLEDAGMSGPGVTTGAPRVGEQQLTDEERGYIDWAQKNPNDANAKKILELYKGKF